MKTNLFLAFLAVSLLTGCSALNPGVKVPKTDLKVSTKAWDFRLQSSKDTDLSKLSVSLQTNGAVTVSLDKFVATNSPVVIKETGIAQKITIDSQGNVLDKAGNVIGKVVDGVVKIYAPIP